MTLKEISHEIYKLITKKTPYNFILYGRKNDVWFIKPMMKKPDPDVWNKELDWWDFIDYQKKEITVDELNNINF